MSDCIVGLVLLFLLNIITVSDGANIDMFVNNVTKISVNKDLSTTYGLKFCVRSDHGILLTFVPQNGVYNMFFRYQVEVGNTDPDWTCGRGLASSSTQGKNYQTGLVDFTTPVCFWTIWYQNWYFLGLGDWGQKLLWNYRNLTQTPFGGVFASTKANGQNAYLTVIDEPISAADAQTKAQSSLYVPQSYAGPVATTTDPNEVTTVPVVTVSGAPYVDLNIDLSTRKAISFTITVNSMYFGGYVALYDKNNADFVNSAYEFNPFRYGYLFSFGGVDKPITYNLNNYGNTPVVNGTVKTVWLSWLNARFAAGMGDTVGVNTVLAWDDPNPRVINGIKIKSKDVNVNWTIPKVYYPI